MIVGYDSPNHALLVHFGATQRRTLPRLESWEMSYAPGTQTRVETALDPETGTLVAIHFCRGGFFVPSFDSRRDLVARWLFTPSAREVRINLAVVPKLHDPVWVRPGIELFLSLPQRTGRRRPFLHGFRIVTLAQPIELDLGTIDIRVAPESLAGAQVNLFVELVSGQ